MPGAAGAMCCFAGWASPAAHTPPIMTRAAGAVRSQLAAVRRWPTNCCETRSPTFLQIGAFDGVGDDDLRELIWRHRLRGVLVEPQPAAFARLKETYAEQPDVTLLQAAIARAGRRSRTVRSKAVGSMAARLTANTCGAWNSGRRHRVDVRACATRSSVAWPAGQRRHSANRRRRLRLADHSFDRF